MSFKSAYPKFSNHPEIHGLNWQEKKTKGDSVEFTTTTLEGSVLKLNDGTWSKTKTFATYNEALEYLEGLFIKE